MVSYGESPLLSEYVYSIEPIKNAVEKFQFAPIFFKVFSSNSHFFSCCF